MDESDIWVHIPYEQYKKERENWKELYNYVESFFEEARLKKEKKTIISNILYKMEELEEK
jgi:hypothetical protein